MLKFQKVIDFFQACELFMIRGVFKIGLILVELLILAHVRTVRFRIL